MCRQLYVLNHLMLSWFGLTWISIREFTSSSFPVYMYDGEGGYKVMTMGEVRIISYCIDCGLLTVFQLLPDSFGPDDLPK